MESMLSLLGQLMGSNTPTFLACTALIAAGVFFYFKVVPAFAKLKDYEEREASGALSASNISAELDAIKKQVLKLNEEGLNSDSTKLLNDILRAMHELERASNSMGRDTQFTNGVVRDLMQSVNDLHTEVSLIRQKLFNISAAIYSTTGAHDEDRLGDLRGLR